MTKLNRSAVDHRRRMFASACALASIGLVGCAPAPDSAPTTAQHIKIFTSLGPLSNEGALASELSGKPLSDLFQKVVATMHGFQAGNPASAVGVIVLFDPQCPHCGRLWTQSQRLWKEVRFAWIPVPLMNKDSATQGAMILGSPDPIAFMQGHEELILAGKGGAQFDAALAAKGNAKIEVNRQLALQLKVDSVPLIFHPKPSGEVLATKGGIGAEELVVLVQS